MKILKTYKLYIGGEWLRSESGRSTATLIHGSTKIFANVPVASRKDLRAAVDAAKAGQKSWGKKSSFNRSQILYRMAEMCEGKRGEFEELFRDTLGWKAQQSNRAVDEAIEAFIFYAGFCDKFQQIIGAVNPVSGPHHNFTTAEPIGVTALIANEIFDFGKLVSAICPILVGGNSLVVLLGDQCPALMGPLGEIFATSDLPGGVVNLLTGSFSELIEHIGSHMEIEAIRYDHSDSASFKGLLENASDNMKRVVNGQLFSNPLSIEPILHAVEYKTVWHPVGL